MKYAVFFRNVTLGPPKSPTRHQLEAAFEEAGALSPSSFMSNGTVVFCAPDDTIATKVTRAACATLETECGLREPAFLRAVPHLTALVRSDPFAVVPGR